MTDPTPGSTLAAWSIRHPVGVTMITLAAVVLGLFALGRLPVDLLPQISYPEIRVRVLETNVPAAVMEDRVTRPLEEQLAITEDAVAIESRTYEGVSAVDLAFDYGTDMDRALQDASARLSRAQRLLPNTVDQPSITKFNPAQLPVVEFAISSTQRDAVQLRSWVDEVFAKWFVNLPGVASTEVGGGLVREIQVRPDPQRLAALGLNLQDLVSALQNANKEESAGRVRLGAQEYSGRTAGRINDLATLAALPIALPDGGTARLDDLAQVLDTHQDERSRARLNGSNAIKISIQKQPAANTVAVADAVRARLDWLMEQKLVPADITVQSIGDSSVYVRQSLHNASAAAFSGALLAMAVVYLFLGNLRRTLIVGSAIPIGIVVTFALMGVGGLTLNMMTLGGLAVGVGMLVDNAIVILENIQRHQLEGADGLTAGTVGSAEVGSAVVASTTTNLAAVLPFLFIGGLGGLLFSGLIITISAAVFVSLIVALTLVPAYAARVNAAGEGRLRARIDAVMTRVQDAYARRVEWLLAQRARRIGLVALLAAALLLALPQFGGSARQIFLPDLDDGRINLTITADPGTPLDAMDRGIAGIETLLRKQPETQHVFTVIGGFIFGRTQRITSNESSLLVQLKPLAERSVSSAEWVTRMEHAIAGLRLPGLQASLRTGGLRGVRTGRGEDDISLRVQGPDLAVLKQLGDAIVTRLRMLPGLRNVEHSMQEQRQELAVHVDRERAAALGVSMAQIAQALRIALDGEVATDFISGDHSYDVRVRVAPPADATHPEVDLEALVLAVRPDTRAPIHLGDVARVQLTPAPAEIQRDNQQRIVEISASLAEGATPAQVSAAIEQTLADLKLPDGYSHYDAGSLEALRAGRTDALQLLGLALFLVFAVMAVQYESLRNPFIILLGVPFTLIGVALGLALTGLPLSMPVWLGLIMLAGIVVNNAIVLVEYIELLRARGSAPHEAIVQAARLRLRPILMTTLTTVVGLLPLALGLGEGAELLQPLAVCMVAGLGFALPVTLLLIPVLYLWLATPARHC